jgi:hypothetical protein
MDEGASREDGEADIVSLENIHCMMAEPRGKTARLLLSLSKDVQWMKTER